MELIAAAIIAGLIIIVIAFVYSARAKTRKQQKVLTDKINEIAREHKVQWEHLDIGLHRAVALSTDKSTLLFMDFKDTEDGHLQLIDMNEVGDCQLSQTGNMVIGMKNHNATENITKVELQLFFKDRSKDAVALIFYNEIHDGLFEKTTQMNKAEHWQGLLSK
jgi:hypothetical protein